VEGLLWVRRRQVVPRSGNRSDPIQALTGKSWIFFYIRPQNSGKKLKPLKLEIVSLIFWIVNLWDQLPRVFQKSSPDVDVSDFLLFKGQAFHQDPKARLGVGTSTGRS